MRHSSGRVPAYQQPDPNPTQSHPYTRGWGCRSEIEHLPSMHNALGFVKKKKTKTQHCKNTHTHTHTHKTMDDNVVGISNWDTGHKQEETLYCASTGSAESSSLSTKNKGVSLYIPLQAGYRSKKQNSTHIRLHASLLAISFPQCYVTFFMFQFFRFHLSAMPSLPHAS
jgi:hypothetical protein